jgi:NTE family protein
LSGGGTRAAALAYGVLEELYRTTYTAADGSQHSLLDEVEVISSVSGGSFTAAHYAVHGAAIFTPAFKEEELPRRIQSGLLWRLFNPWNLIRLASPSFSRSDLAAEYYDEEIFDGRTFADLQSAGQHGRRPFTIINATDMSSGARFEFTQDQFDVLCSDLAPMSVGRAVAASSAFPGAFTALTQHNYAHATPPCGYRRPQWVDTSFAHDRLENNERFALAQALDSYLRTEPATKDYVHLLDGGVADNLGLRGPMQALRFNPETPWSLSNLINNDEVRRVVVIAVNAKPAPLSPLDTTARAPGILPVAVASGTIPMENYTFETSDLLRREIDDIRAEEPDDEAAADPPAALTFYWAEVRFDALPDATERACYNAITTELQLDESQTEALIGIGPLLLCAQPEYQQLRRDLGLSGGCDTPPPPRPAVKPQTLECTWPEPQR